MVELIFTKFGRFVWSKPDLKYVTTLKFTLDGPRENLKKRDSFIHANNHKSNKHPLLSTSQMLSG